MKHRRKFSNSDDIIDSRDVIARIAELEDEDEEEDYDGEREVLRKLAEQCEHYGDWAHGEALIHESHFKQYAQELAEEIGAVDVKRIGNWPYSCIDWDQAANELKADYMEVDFDGETYLMRA